MVYGFVKQTDGHIKIYSEEDYGTYVKLYLPQTAGAPEALATYQQCTGRTAAPIGPFYEAWLCCGRRAGKSFILALVAVFLAWFRDWTPFLVPGEVGRIVIIEADRNRRA